MNILITNIGRRVYFVDFLMDLKKNFKNLNIHLANNDQFSSIINYKKTKIHKIPLISHGSKKYIDAIKNIVLKNKINLIIPITKYDLKILSLNKEKLRLYNCEVLVSSYNLIKNLLNKESAYFFCKKKNIKTPKIYSNFKEVSFKKSKQFIRKKKFGNSSVGIKIIKKLNKNHFKKNYVIQDFIYGKELHFDILNDFNGDYLASCVKQKIAMRSGETDKAKTLYSKKFENLAKKISYAFRHIGNMDCDAIIKKNGTVFFLDFNPVFGGGYPFTHLSGFNYIKAILNLKKNKRPSFPHKPKIVKMAKGISVHIIK